MLVLLLLLFLTNGCGCNCPSIMANNTCCNVVHVSAASGILNSNFTVVENGIVCVPLSDAFLNCSATLKWAKYEYSIEFNLVAAVVNTGQYYDPTDYFIDGNDSLVVCRQPEDAIRLRILYNVNWIVYGLTVISMVSLVISLVLKLTYFRPTCHNKCLIAHLSCLATLYVLYTVKQFILNVGGIFACYLMFVTVYFCYMAAIFWLNVIAFETWRFFSQMQTSPYNLSAISTVTRWRMYNLYAWGIPLFMTTIVLATNFMPMPRYLAVILDPQLRFYCFINARLPTAIYYYAPMGCLMVANLIFFGLTVHIINYASIGTGDVNSHRRKSVMNVTMKLLLVMGIFWLVAMIFDVVGFNVPLTDAYLFRLNDIAYIVFSSQGIVIALAHVDRKFCKWEHRLKSISHVSLRQLSTSSVTTSVD